MQKYEYRTYVRVCGAESDPCYQTNVWSKSTAWNLKVDDNLHLLGADGWELVTICQRPNEELWVFKRPID